MSTGTRLAAAALGLAALAALAGTGPRGAPGGVGPVELTPELSSGAAMLGAIELAGMIRDRRPLRLLDVRDSSEFVRFAIPTARHVQGAADLAALPVEEDGGPVVVYDDGSGAAIRGWLLLRRLGHPDVRVLRDGALGWVDHVLSPVLPASTDEERARFDSVAGLSRYFGGVPKVGEPPDRAADPDRTRAAITLISRRGCY